MVHLMSKKIKASVILKEDKHIGRATNLCVIYITHFMKNKKVKRCLQINMLWKSNCFLSGKAVKQQSLRKKS